MTASNTLTASEARRILAMRDLTDPNQGHHVVQDVIDAVAKAVGVGLPTHLVRRHGNPVVTVADNYDRLGYRPDAASRDSRYSRYLTEDLMLRAHTSAMIPVALEEVARDQRPADVTVLCPGMVYRRDVIDRQHVGEPHQLDVWRVATEPTRRLAETDLDDLVDRIVAAVLPGRRWRAIPATHPYTLAGRQIDVADADRWVEVGEWPGTLHDLEPRRGGCRVRRGRVDHAGRRPPRCGTDQARRDTWPAQCARACDPPRARPDVDRPGGKPAPGPDLYHHPRGHGPPMGDRAISQ